MVRLLAYVPRQTLIKRKLAPNIFEFETNGPVFNFLLRPWWRRWWYSLLIHIGKGPIIETMYLAWRRQFLGECWRVKTVLTERKVLLERV